MAPRLPSFLMQFPYSFTSPSEAQLQRRRHLLDTYGQLAQVSALIPLLACHVPLLVRFAWRRFLSAQSPRQAKGHASPVTSRFGEQSERTEHIRVKQLGHVQWLLDQKIYRGWGAWKVLLIAVLWTTWLFILAVRDTEDGMSTPYRLFQSIHTCNIVSACRNIWLSRCSRSVALTYDHSGIALWQRRLYN